MRKTIVAVLLASCAGTPTLAPATPMSVDDHAAAASDHEQAAELNARQADEAQASSSVASYDCGDTVLGDQASSGGERIVNIMPCFNVEDEEANHHRMLADKEQRAARHDRAAADRMLAAETQSCAGIAPRELDHTAFTHRRDIAAVVPVLDHNRVTGARIQFKAVRALSASWLQTSLACHEAQFAAAGKDPKLMSYDPTLVDTAKVAVFTRADGSIEVAVTSSNDTAAAVILGRAQDLLSAQTADATSP